MRALAAVMLAAVALLTACCPPAVGARTTVESFSGGGSQTGIAAGPVSSTSETPVTSPGAGPRAVQASSHAERFEAAWRLVRDRYWDLESVGVDWDEVGASYRERLPDVDDDDELFSLLEEMYEEIGDQHSTFVRPERVAEVRRTYGDLPCLAVFSVEAGLRAPVAFYSPLGAQVMSERSGPIRYGLQGEGEDAIGYLKVPDLASDGVAEGVRGAVSSMVAAGAQGIVLDLRGNPGGRLVTMMQVAGVFTRGFLWRAVLAWSLPVPYPAIGEPATDLPLVVLVDGNVNSAAEGLAGALQGNGRATVIGETTAGNVEAVLPFCLRDGSQAWIATGVLAPLLGATWEGRGVEPDVVVEPEGALDHALELLRSGR